MKGDFVPSEDSHQVATSALPTWLKTCGEDEFCFCAPPGTVYHQPSATDCHIVTTRHFRDDGRWPLVNYHKTTHCGLSSFVWPIWRHSHMIWDDQTFTQEKVRKAPMFFLNCFFPCGVVGRVLEPDPDVILGAPQDECPDHHRAFSPCSRVPQQCSEDVFVSPATKTPSHFCLQ